MAAPRWIFVAVLFSLSLQLCSSNSPLATNAMDRKEAQDDHDHSSHRTLATGNDVDHQEVKDDHDHKKHNGKFSRGAIGTECANNNNDHGDINMKVGCFVPPPDYDRCCQDTTPPCAPLQPPPRNRVIPSSVDPQCVIPLPPVIPTPTCQPADPGPRCGSRIGFKKKEHSESAMAMAPESGLPLD